MQKIKENNLNVLFGVLVITLFFFIGFVSSATEPAVPDGTDLISNETKSVQTEGGTKVNISGGRIATLNLNTTVQNPRWKAFVGNVTGSFTLDDASDSTIYDWSLSVTTGRVYSTKNSTTPSWTSIDCSNISVLEQENQEMNHTAGDNITATFNASNPNPDHDAFYVGSALIDANSCPTLSTYQNDAPQAQGSDVFEEVALYDGINVIYAALLEEGEVGFDGNIYDFQMIVPENGADGFGGATAYYLYVELD